MMDCCSAFKGKGILTQVTVWVNPEDIMLREIRRSQKDKYGLIPLIGGTQSSQLRRDRKWNGMVGVGGWGRGNGKSSSMDTELQFCEIKLHLNISELKTVLKYY